MKVFIYTLILLLSCLLQSGLAQIDLAQTDPAQIDPAQSDSNTTQTSEGFFSVSIDPVSLSNSEFIADMQAGSKDGYFMQRFGLESPTLMFDYDTSLIIPIDETGVSLYFGVGVNVLFFIVTAIAFDAHAGLEIKLIDEVAVFSEYEATFGLRDETLQNFKVGLNFYF